MDQKYERLLKRGVDTIYPTPDFLEQKLVSGQRLKVYLGVDPTGEVHVGHTVPLRKLRHFQELGHQVVLLIGSFTAQIGDPTDKSQTRKQLTKEQVLENAKNYAQFAAKILDFNSDNKPQVVYNGDWLEKLTFKEVVELAAHFTVQQMMERDMFQKRLEAGLPISLHEFLYPLMQGYDSVMLDVDFEIGGTDQTFNMLAGRKLIEQYKGKEKGVVTVPLITDNNGKKMGKSEGNAIPLNLAPADMFGRVMSLSDGFLYNMFLLCTDTPVAEIDEMLVDLSIGANPMVYKKKLAYLITETFHGSDAARQAQHEFESTVQGDALPEDIPEVLVNEQHAVIRDLLVELKLCASNGEAKRMIEENAVSVYSNSEERRITNSKEELELMDGLVIRVGKRRFVRVRLA